MTLTIRIPHNSTLAGGVMMICLLALSAQWHFVASNPVLAGSTGPVTQGRALQADVAPILWVIPAYVQQPLSDYLWAIGANGYEHAVLMRIALEESGYNRWAKNPVTPAYSTFQYMIDTWNGQCWGDIFDYQAQARCALKDLRAGLIGQWEVTKKW